jgi:hypothetical protein
MLIPLYFRVMLGKLGESELRFLRIAHLLIDIYLPTKFHVDISYSFRVMSRTRFF